MDLKRFFNMSESEQFIFYRVPKVLFTNERYVRVTAEAKLLYGFLLDRMGLSARNGWCTEEGIIFVYFTVSESAENLHCGLEKAGRLFSELEKAGLILRKKQGQGKPAKIFICKFIADIGKSKVKKSEKPMSRQPNFRGVDLRFSDENNTDLNNIEFSDIHLPIYDDGDKIVRDQIEYDILIQKLPKEKAKIDEVVCLIADTVCTTKNTIRIAGNDFPAEAVRARFRKLTSEHIEYVIDMLNKNTTEVRNIRAYLLTALYNSPATIDSYYSALVNHDLYGK